MLHPLQKIFTFILFSTNLCSSKFHRMLCHTGTDRVQNYSSTLSLTSALDGGGWLLTRRGRFTPGNETVSII
jgi:hypothetical protein